MLKKMIKLLKPSNRIADLEEQVFRLNHGINVMVAGFKSEVKALKDESWRLKQHADGLEIKIETLHKINYSSIRRLNKRTKHLEEGRKRSLLK